MSFEEMSKYGGTIVKWFRSRLEKNQEEKQDRLRKEEFFAELSRARKDLQAAHTNYNFAQEPALLEYYIYEIKAAETRLNYYLKLAKKDNLSNDGYLSGVFAGSRREEIS
ncbi:MAG: DUF2508 family protein [Clostridia bacterium]|nr:DUF2508 family protein [Clostridia bacterium]